MGSDAPAQDSARHRTDHIVGLTVHAMATDRDECLEIGCDDYDSKPVELGRLLENPAPAWYRRGVGRNDWERVGTGP
jgi:CheY-like chemotaxis protein